MQNSVAIILIRIYCFDKWPKLEPTPKFVGLSRQVMVPTKVLLLLLCINGIPPLLARFFPEAANGPLDNNRRFFDGYPIFGRHKTIGGFLCGILTGGIIGYLIGFSFALSLLAGLLGMLGDILTSFIKRRLRLAEGTELPIFDQAFEGGFPMLLFHRVFPFSWQTTLAVFLMFLIIGWAGAKIFKRAFTPRRRNSLGLVRSASRFREWRACHIALSPFARALNFESVLYYRWFMKGVFTSMGIYNKGVMNALNVQVKSIDMEFPTLPQAFNGYRILFISDLHIDGLDGLDDRLRDLVSKLKADICLLGGDYKMEMYGQFFKANRKLRDLVKHINAHDGIFGILGNHDCLEVAPELEDSGIYMLINDSITLKRNGQALCIIGTDDPHYYKCNDLEKAFEDVPYNAFSILLSHSPEIIKDTDEKKIDLCLCGHTHGGQICLPIVGPVFTHASVPRRFASGLWRHNAIVGYTSNGAGTSGIPVRFNCMPEVVLLTLSRSNASHT